MGARSPFIVMALVLCALNSFQPPSHAAGYNREHCDRFDDRLTPDLINEADQILAELNALSADSGTVGARQLTARYLDQLARIQDSVSPPPSECIVVAAVPTEQRGLVIAAQMLFITDRAQLESSVSGSVKFGAQRRKTGVAMGKAQVDLHWGGRCSDNPTSRTWIWPGEKLVRQMLLPAATFVLDVGDTRVFTKTLREFKSAGTAKRPVHAVIFVHGFNVSFNDALWSAAELVNCLKGDVLPIVVSWPSAEKMSSYLEDEETISVSRERLRAAIEWLFSQADIDEFTLVAHSMGTRLVTRILADLELAGKKFPRLSRVVFAAADLGEEEFAEYWARLRPLPKQGWTFYVSRSDLAMWASTAVHRRPRIGDSRARVFTIDAADTVEATNVAPLRKAIGHSYIIDSVSVSRDVRGWAMQEKSPAQRGLKKLPGKPVDYWSIPRE